MTEDVSKAILTEEHLMATSQSLNVAKEGLRSLIKAKLALIPKSALEAQSYIAFQALLNLDRYKKARRISVYLSMPTGEIQTDEIVRHALSNGKEVFVPYLYKDNGMNLAGPKKLMDMVRLIDVKDYESLERDSWGIPTVTEHNLGGRQWVLADGNGEKLSSHGGLDLILMPGVAFAKEQDSSTIRRLGHGKGFYDYFVHRYQNRINSHYNSLALYGLALKEQFLQGDGSEVPVGPLDCVLHGLIVGDGQTICVAPYW